MKAYYVDTKDAEHPEIVFAMTRANAIAKSEAYIETGEWTECRARRQPQFDKWATCGYVPKSELIENGWWFECFGIGEDGKRCSKTVHTDTPAPYFEDDHAFCCKGCFDRLG